MKVMPSLLLARFSQTHNNESIIVLFLEDERRYAASNLEVSECVERISEFPSRDNGGRNSLEIEEEFILALKNHRPFEEFSRPWTEDFWGMLEEFFHAVNRLRWCF